MAKFIIWAVVFLPFLFFPLAAASFFQIVEQGENNMTIEWNAPDLEWKTLVTSEETFVLPLLADLPLQQKEGWPQLPYDALHPLKSGSWQLSIVDSIFEIRSCTAICPAPGFDILKDENDRRYFFRKDSLAYRNNLFMPQNFTQVDLGEYRNQRLHRLQVNPIKYNPVLNQIHFLRYLKILLTYSSPNSARLSTSELLPPIPGSPAPLWKRTSSLGMTEISDEFSPGAKLYTLAEGVYQISGADLTRSGIAVSTIDPQDVYIENRGRTLPCMIFGSEDGKIDPEDRILFFADRLSGEEEYYHAYSDTNIYWLRWHKGAGAGFATVASERGENAVLSFQKTLHLEQDIEYYQGDSNLEIQSSDQVPGEGWVWDSAIDPDETFRIPFDLPGLKSEAGLATLRFRVRGETRDSYLNSHHLRVYINQNLVVDTFFDDRQELIPEVQINSALLKKSGNLFELQSKRENPNIKSRFYFDWLKVDYQQRTSVDNGFLRLPAQKSPDDYYWVQGFSSPNVHIWDVNNALAIKPASVGKEWLADIQVVSAGLADGNYAHFAVNDQTVFTGARGINLVAVNHEEGRVLHRRTFDTYAAAAESDSLAAFLTRLADNTIILAGVMDDGAANLTATGRAAFESLGSREISNLQYRDSWAFIGRKGTTTPLAEQRVSQNNGQASVFSRLFFTGDSTFHVQFSFPAGGKDFILFEESTATTPHKIKYVEKNLKQEYTGADYIIVTHRNFLRPAEELARWRETHNGFSVFIADVEEIYNVFNDGIPDPLAVKAFLRFAFKAGNPQPRFVLLFGDGSWDAKKNMPSAINTNFVPVLGNPVSDALFVCFGDSTDILPDMSIGRIPVKNDVEADASVAKIIEYEQEPSSAWKKNFLFISGGADQAEQQQFKSQSTSLANDFIVTPPTFGRFLSINKTQEQQVDFRSLILETIDAGALWINFIGHAASRTWELMFNTPDINDLNNKGKYPFISSMTCHTGRFAEPTQESFSEHFLLLPDKGAIGFWGTSGWGYSYEDYQYLREMFPTVTVDTVRFLGDIVTQTKIKLWTAHGQGEQYTNLILQYNLLGDPGVQLSLPILSDLALEAKDITLKNLTPGESDSTVEVQARVGNWGLGTRDSVKIDLSMRNVVTGAVHSLQKTIPPVGLESTVPFNVPLKGMTGVNELKVNIDPENAVTEFDENNNAQSIRMTVLTSDLQLVAPPAHSLVPISQVELKVQAPQQLFDENQRYIFELDTSATFSSPAFRTSPEIRAHPLLIRWAPDFLLPDCLYYWRIAAAGDSHPVNSFTGSFFAAAGNQFGWMQRNDYYIGNTLEHVESRNDGFSLSSRQIPLLLQSSRSEQVGYALIEVDRRKANQPGRGHHLVVINHYTGDIKATGHFDTYGDVNAPAALTAFIADVTKGDYVLAAIEEEGGLNLTEQVYAAYESIGSAFCRQIGYRDEWAIIGRKGNAVGSVPEDRAPAGGLVVILKDTLQLRYPRGEMRSSPIGPASAWDQASLEVEIPDSSEFNWFIHAFSSDYTDTLTLPVKDQFSVDLKSIDGSRYPLLSLVASFTSHDGRHSPKLKQWQTLYKSVPDLALSPQLFAQTADSVILGQTVNFFLDVYNIGLISSDSSLIRLERFDSEKGRIHIQDIQLDSIVPDKYRPINFKWTAAPQTGLVKLFITVDPEQQQNELSKANNDIIAQVYVGSDTLTPKVSLTFDGRDIMDGDLVSQQPIIIAKIEDNNPEAMTDTSRVIVTLDGRRIPFRNSEELKLTSGGDSQVRGILHYHPQLSAGEHLLVIQVSDAGRNQAVVQTRFVVENNLLLRQVLNFPNPMTDFTEFCYEISQPADVTIKIYTVAGRLIRTL
ncbi:MAG: hypothetical protein EHM72_02795 [Calditrichaeota bacterium]|nr:MAG: hypothetical protein EHM72_02795 [Calditrichota bacterium]